MCSKTEKENREMNDNVIENNNVIIMGEVKGGFQFSHEVFGEGFYMVDVSVRRLSDSVDVLPVMVSERLLNVKKNLDGKLISVSGQFRSYNQHSNEKNKLVLYVFARDVEFLEEYPDDESKTNSIYLNGFICKPPVYRKTPLGREITDLLLAVNRPYGKSDYIPCICWGRNARYSSEFEVSSPCMIWGRIQSRDYTKKLLDGTTEPRVAYEVSVSKITQAEEVPENKE